MMSRTITEDQYMDDHTSLALSLESFNPERLLPVNSTHSIYHSESEPESDNSSAPWSPPAWRKGTSGWQQRHHLAPPSATGSRQSSSRCPSFEEDGDDTLLPANVPLPESPEKETPFRSIEPTPDLHLKNNESLSPRRPETSIERDTSVPAEPANNYIRFAMRAEVQHRTEPLEAAFEWMREKVDGISFKSVVSAIGTALLSYFMLQSLFRAPEPLPAPDILKAVHLARTFEPMIYYSESGLRQVTELHDTSSAVWDLGESIRLANLTAGPSIAAQLDEMSNTLDVLSLELTKFFVEVDADVDSILLVMDWAKRRLDSLEPLPSGTILTATDNIQGFLGRIGITEYPNGDPNVLGRAVRAVFGTTTLQRNTGVLQKTFQEFLNVLEESINNELQHSIMLFSLFGGIDKQFRNLQQSTIRESDKQETEESEMLSSLWTRLVGPRASHIRKFEKNKNLLKNIRSQTILNKSVVQAHNTKLLHMKASLDRIRQKVTSQLLRSNDSTTVPVDEQIQGLVETYQYLRGSREKQKQRTRDMVGQYGSNPTKPAKDTGGEDQKLYIN